MNIGIIIKVGNDSVSIDIKDNKVTVNDKVIKFDSSKKDNHVTKELRVCANELCKKTFEPTGNRQKYCRPKCRPKKIKPDFKEKTKFEEIISKSKDENAEVEKTIEPISEKTGMERLSALKKLRNKFFHPLSQIQQ